MVRLSDVLDFFCEFVIVLRLLDCSAICFWCSVFVVVCQFILFYVFAIAIFVLFVSLRCLDLDGPSASTCVLYGSLWVDFGSRCLYFVVPKSAPVRDKENTLHRDFSRKLYF